MNDHPDLFADPKLVASPRKAARKRPTPPPEKRSDHTARLFAFPPHRDMRIVGRLLDRWMGLRKRYDYEGAYRIFSQLHEGPIKARLQRLGMSTREVNAEVLQVHFAMEALNDRRLADARQHDGTAA